MFARNILIVVLALHLWGSEIRPERFAAIVDMEPVLYAERSLIEDVKKYIRRETIRLRNLQSFIDELEEENDEALDDPHKFISNPVNSFLLLKSLTIDWNLTFRSTIHCENTHKFQETILSNTLPLQIILRDEEDVRGAAFALFRLQDTYNLSVDDIAYGDIHGYQTSRSLSVDDCFELGRFAFENYDYDRALLWLNRTATSPDFLEELSRAKQILLIEYMAFISNFKGNLTGALNFTLVWLQLEPNNVQAQRQRHLLQTQLSAQNFDGNTTTTEKQKDAGAQYSKLCRGESLSVYKDAHKLTCQYRRRGSLFYLAPLKEEVLYFEPWLAIYHDVLTGEEMNKMTQLATPLLTRSGVLSSRITKISEYRVGKTAWLGDMDDPLISRVSQKAKALSGGLSLQSSEPMQVVNYGIGGYYGAHYDWWNDSDVSEGYSHIYHGNRIATVIFYLSDVEVGGATVFPRIGVNVPPEKGSAAVWFNLHQNGSGIYNTEHSGCPVLIGNKWISNKWFHTYKQEFIRPCTTNEHE